MDLNTRQTNSTIKKTYIWCPHAIYNKFRLTAFSRSVQTPFVRPMFDAVVSKHIPMLLEELKTASAPSLPDSEASLERKSQEALCLNQQVVSPRQVPVQCIVCLPNWCNTRNIRQLGYFPSPCSARKWHNTLGRLEVLMFSVKNVVVITTNYYR